MHFMNFHQRGKAPMQTTDILIWQRLFRFWGAAKDEHEKNTRENSKNVNLTFYEICLMMIDRVKLKVLNAN